ncbi:MAG: hypothetical protein Q9226_008670 [Calogaya cf. arnoldii]
MKTPEHVARRTDQTVHIYYENVTQDYEAFKLFSERKDDEEKDEPADPTVMQKANSENDVKDQRNEVDEKGNAIREFQAAQAETERRTATRIGEKDDGIQTLISKLEQAESDFILGMVRFGVVNNQKNAYLLEEWDPVDKTLVTEFEAKAIGPTGEIDDLGHAGLDLRESQPKLRPEDLTSETNYHEIEELQVREREFGCTIQFPATFAKTSSGNSREVEEYGKKKADKRKEEKRKEEKREEKKRTEEEKKKKKENLAVKLRPISAAKRGTAKENKHLSKVKRLNDIQNQAAKAIKTAVNKDLHSPTSET